MSTIQGVLHFCSLTLQPCGTRKGLGFAHTAMAPAFVHSELCDCWGETVPCLWLNSNLLLNHFSQWMALVLCSHKSKKCFFLLVLIVNNLIWIQSWHQKSIISVSLVEVGGVGTSVICPYLCPSLPAIGVTFTQVGSGELGCSPLWCTWPTQQCCLPSLYTD